MNIFEVGIASFPCCYWLTGLPGSGKSTLAIGFAKAMQQIGEPCLVLDGDEVRKGLCSDLGYSRKDRAENVRRIGEVAKLVIKANIIVVVAAISPYADDRLLTRKQFAVGQYIEVFVNAPISVCRQRDIKGNWAAAKSGNLQNFTGFGDPYETPIAPDMEIASDRVSVTDSIQLLCKHYQRQRDEA